MKLSGPLLALASCMLLALPVQTSLAACSDGSDGNKAYVGKATLNEYYHNNQSPINAKDYFIEAKLLYSNLNKNDYGDWSILICSQVAADNLASECITGYQPMTNPADPAYLADTAYDPALQLSNASGNQSWLVLDQTTGYPAGYIDNNGGAGHGMEVFLLDANGEIIDYTSVGGYTKHAATLGAASCNYLFDNTIPGSNTFTMQRLEDGTGCWPQSPTSDTDVTANGSTIPCLGLTPPSGSSGDPTDEAPNLDTSSSGNYLYISLSPELATVPVGGTVTYTVSITGALVVTNKTTYTDTTITTSDIDLSLLVYTMDGTTTAPAPSVSTISIPAGSTQVSFSIDTSTLSPDPAVDSDFTTIVSIDPNQTFPTNKDTRGVFFSPGISLVTFAASGPDHYVITHSGSGITCEASSVTITPHDANHAAVAPPASTTITLSTTPANDGWTSDPGNGGSFTPPNQYTFGGTETSATFWLSKQSAATLDIDVTDGTASDPDDGGAEDLPITYSNTLLQFVADDGVGGYSTVINNQIGGKPSSTAPDNQNLFLRAVETDLSTGTCVPALASTAQNVSLGYQCIEPNTCTANEMKLTAAGTYDSASTTTLPFNNGLTTVNTSPSSLTFNATGLAPISFQYDNIGQIALYAADLTVNGAVISGSSSTSFIAKPQAIVATASDPTPYQAGVGGGVDIKAVLWDSDNTNLSDNPTATQFGRETTPQLSFSFTSSGPADGNSTIEGNALPLTSGGTTQTITLTNADFTNGVGTVALNWDEVGTLSLTTISDYLGSGALSTTTDVPFIPYDLLIEVSNPGVYENTHTGGATDFTYLGETFGYTVNPQFTVSAVAYCATPPCPVTTNYAGTWASKISSSTLPTTDQNGTDNTVDWSMSGINYTPSDFVAGVATITIDANTSYTKPNDPLAPFTSNIDPSITIDLTTSDGLNANQLLTFDTTGNLQRFGRAVLLDTYGPGDLDLPLTYYTEYFDGAGFIPNTDDLDTSLSATDLSCVAAFSCSVDGSAADLQVSGTAITPGNFFTLSPTTTLSGTATFQFTGPAWLSFDWDGDATTPATFDTASASFGLYRGDDRFYYWREER